jgi:scyllo-inositol 2-dehydrogenase (NADP+)
MYFMQTPISTGICSYGMSGKLFHAPFIHAHPGFHLAAIVERHKEESKEKYPAATLYRSIEEMCADKSLQLIVVNTPTYLHYEQTKLALQSGKHVVVEKPFTVTVKEGEELNALAQKNNLFLSVYHNRRYDGDYLAVKKVVGENLLGEIKEVEIRYNRYRTGTSGKQHKEGTLPGAGVLYDLSPHMIDQAVQLFGMPHAVWADTMTMRENVQADDYFEMVLYYNNMRVRLIATCIARETIYAYTLHGMKGSFLQQRSDMQEQQLLAAATPSFANWCPVPALPDGLLHTEINGEIVRQQTTSTPGNYMNYYDEVYKALTVQALNPVPAFEAINNIRIIEAALQSVNKRKMISVK